MFKAIQSYIMKSKFSDHTVNRRSHSLHDVYAIMLEQQAHLDVTSTKVTQPTTLKSCIPYLYLVVCEFNHVVSSTYRLCYIVPCRSPCRSPVVPPVVPPGLSPWHSPLKFPLTFPPGLPPWPSPLAFP